MTPLAPGRLSTMTGWPSACASSPVTNRATTSTAPPGGSGTMTWIGLTGQFCAHKDGAAKPNMAAAREKTSVRMKPLPGSAHSSTSDKGYNPPRRNTACDGDSQMARIGSRGEMEAFVRSVELGGFSAAARELKLTPSALSKLVSRLETALRVRLLSRTTRKLIPTAEGELFLARCRRIIAEMEDAETEVGRSREQPRGRLRLHVGVGFATHLVMPSLPGFSSAIPKSRSSL